MKKIHLKCLNKQYKTNYLNLINKYTNIIISGENTSKKDKNEEKGLFKDLYECTTFKNHAIRFNDCMKCDEFEKVFEILTNDLGNPDLFGEYDGYIWKMKGYIITFGFVSLNYNYEVPMICVKNKISIFSNSIDYKKYNEIAISMNEPLIKRGIYASKISYYKINYYREYGFSMFVHANNHMLNINYKKPKLSISISPINHFINKEIIENQKKYNKKIWINNDFELKNKLEELLEETKEYHNLKKK